MADDISDALAASLLKKEASERSLRYSAFGLVAFAGEDRKKPNSVPKPNTRFLKNLVKEADSHNTALLAKEAEEARLRLEKFRRDERRRRDRDRAENSRSRSPDRVRRRRDRSRSTDRKHRDSEEHGRERKRQKVGVADIDRLLQASRREKRNGAGTDDSKRSKERDRERSRRDRSRSRERERQRDRHGRNKDRSRSPDRRKYRSRESRSRSRSRSSSQDRRSRKHQSHRSRRRSLSRSHSPQRRKPPTASGRLSYLDDDDDDDPLAAYLNASSKSSPEIGPTFPNPGSKPRGRGGQGSSAMDARFDPSYDPTLDVAPENPEEVDDWEAALEAMRDRQKWKQQGAERLRSAGFDNDFIEAWETNTTKDEKRIKWNTDKGGRDWDRGKVFDEDTGEVKLKASWAK